MTISRPRTIGRRLLVVDDDPRVRGSLGRLLSAHGWHPVLAATAAAAIVAAHATPPLAVLLDLGLPDREGIDLLRELRSRWPVVPVLVLTSASTEASILAAIRAGAQGYLFKEDVGPRLTAALDEALAGGAPMSRDVARLVLDQLRGSPDPVGGTKTGAKMSTGIGAKAAPSPLTAREIEIVEQLALGLTYGQVGTALGISLNTVRSHIRTIYEKLAAGSRTEAVLTALRLGLVTGGARSPAT